MDSDLDLCSGCLVRISGLKSAAELNDSLATCLGSAANDRWAVATKDPRIDSQSARLGDTSISILSRDPSFQKSVRIPGETTGF